MSRIALAAVVLAATLTVSGTAAAHGDHPIPTPGIIGVPSLTVNAGGPGATWEFVASIPTGNPHTTSTTSRGRARSTPLSAPSASARTRAARRSSA